MQFMVSNRILSKPWNWEKKVARAACIILVCIASFSQIALAQDDADQDPLEQYLIQKNFQNIGQAGGNLVSDLAQLSATKAQATMQIEQARREFWKQYPNGPNLKAAAGNFFSLLRQKDLYYAFLDSMFDVSGPSESEGTKIDMGAQIIFGKGTGDIDGGIRKGAVSEYVRWTTALHATMIERMKESDASAAGIAEFVTAFPYAVEQTQQEYREYVIARDWAELDLAHREPAWITSTPLYNDAILMRNGDFSRQQSVSAYQAMADVFGKERLDHAALLLRQAEKDDEGWPANPSALGLVLSTDLTDEDLDQGEGHGIKRPAPPGLMIVMRPTLYSALTALLGSLDGRSYLIVLLSEKQRGVPNPDQWQQCVQIYKKWVLAYGEPAVRAEADRILKARKAWSTDWVLDQSNRPLDPPYDLFQRELATKDPKGFIRSNLIFGKKTGGPEQVDSTYRQLVQTYGEPRLLQAAQQLIDDDYTESEYADAQQAKMLKFLSGIIPVTKTVMVPNDDYARWKDFKSGASVTSIFRMWNVRGQARAMYPDPVYSTYTLRQIDGNFATIDVQETVLSTRQRVIEYPAMDKVTVSANAPPQPPPAQACPTCNSSQRSGWQTLNIGGVPVLCHWDSEITKRGTPGTPNFTTTVHTVWTSEAVPGFVVKDVGESDTAGSGRSDEKTVTAFKGERTTPLPEQASAKESAPPSAFDAPQPDSSSTAISGSIPTNPQTVGQSADGHANDQSGSTIAPNIQPEVRNTQAPQPPENLAGVYAGRFRCGPEWFDLRLTVTEAVPGMLTAVFDYSPLSPPIQQRFIFDLAGREIASSHQFQLNPTRWETGHPLQYQMVAMTGALDPATRQLNGKFSNIFCGAFHLSRSETSRQVGR